MNALQPFGYPLVVVFALTALSITQGCSDSTKKTTPDAAVADRDGDPPALDSAMDAGPADDAGDDMGRSTGDATRVHRDAGAGDTGTVDTDGGLGDLGISDTGASDLGLGDVGVGDAGGGHGRGLDPVQVPWGANFNLPPQDEAGFSIFTPSADSRIVYVSAVNGDDATGVVYSHDSPQVGADPFLPGGQVMAFSTIREAHSHMRTGFPDWILLERGGLWTISARIEAKSGRSIDERSIIGAYGNGPERPLIRTGTSTGVRFWRDVRYAVVMGLAFRAHQRDPDDPAFIGFDAVESVAGFQSYSADEASPITGILIEDSTFTYYSNNLAQGTAPTTDFVVRRCQFSQNYSTTSHSQGLYTKGVSVLLEENLFDHNGWYRQSYVRLNDRAEGQATFYNHNTYFTNTRNTIFRRNIFLRASSIGNKFTANPEGGTNAVMAENILLDNNLYVEGEIGVSAGGNTDHGDGYRWRNILIMNNILLDIGRGRPTNRSLGWGVEARDWDGGAIADNYFLHYGSAEVGNIYALGLQGHTRAVDVSGNVMHGLNSGRYAVAIDGDPKEQISFSRNQLQFGGTQMRLIDSDYVAPGTFSDNRYFTDNDARRFRAGGNDADFAGWQAAVGDVGSGFEEVSYVDPGRTVESYMASLGGDPTLQAFIAAAKTQSKQHWRPAYTAGAVNAYVRRGYEIDPP